MSLFKASDERETETITAEEVGTVEEVFDTDISADDEFDVTDDGIPGHLVVAKINTAVSVAKTGDDGAANLLYKLGLSVLNSPHINSGMTITATFWRRHSNPKAQQIGRGQFKTLAQAVISKNAEGRTAGNLASLIGAYVTAWAKDSGGFPVLGNFKPVDQEALDEALTSAGVGELT